MLKISVSTSLLVSIIFISCQNEENSKLKFWQEKSIITYQFTYENESQYDISKILNEDKSSTPKSTSLHTFAGGFLSLSDVGIIDSNRTLRVDFKDLVVRIESQGQSAPKNSDELAIGMLKPIYITLTDSGSISYVIISDDMPLSSRNYAVAIVSNLQIVKPKRNHEKSWSTIEDDQYGRCLIDYSYKDSSDTRIFFKKKNYYLEGTSDNSFFNLQYIPESNSQIECTTEKTYCQSIQFEEKMLVLANGFDSGSSQSKMQASLLNIEKIHNSKKAKLQDAFIKFKKSGKSLTLFEVQSQGNYDEVLANQTLGADNMESIMKLLRNVEKGKINEDVNIYLKIKSLIIVHPETADSLAVMIMDEPHNSIRFKIIGDALAYSGKNSAQKAILGLIRYRISSGNNPEIFVSLLTKVDHPTVEVFNLLRALINKIEPDSPLWQTVVLTLGTVAWKALTSNHQESDNSVRLLIQVLEQAKNPSAEVHLMLALGNSGNPLILPTLEKWLLSPGNDPEVRAAAVWAMRLLPGASIDRKLQILNTNSSLKIRESAIEALNTRPYLTNNLSHLVQCFDKESDINLRKRIFYSILKFEDYDSLTIQNFLVHAKKDDEESIQKIANNELKKRKEPY